MVRSGAQHRVSNHVARELMRSGPILRDGRYAASSG